MITHTLMSVVLGGSGSVLLTIDAGSTVSLNSLSLESGGYLSTGFSSNTSVTSILLADQSAVGCGEGVGAAACEEVCRAQGLGWTQIRDKCWQPLARYGGSASPTPGSPC